MKIKTDRGRRFVKELGGAVRRAVPSRTALYLVEHGLAKGRVLDYGCGFGFDADRYGWEGYDPYYRQQKPTGPFDTVVCNHVANMLTRRSRAALFDAIRALLTPTGTAYVSVPRNVPVAGKAAMRLRINNHVVLSLPSLLCDRDLEIYRLRPGEAFEDRTREFEDRM